MTDGTDPWLVIMNTDPPEAPPEASDVIRMWKESDKGNILTHKYPPYVQPPRSTLNNSLRATLTSKPELKEQYEALKSTLHEVAKALGDELTSALSDVQAMTMAGGDQRRYLQQRRKEVYDKIGHETGNKLNKIANKMTDSYHYAEKVVDSIPEDVQPHAAAIYREGFRLLEPEYTASQQVLSMIMEGIQNFARDPIETGSKLITNDVDALVKSITALFDTES